MANFPHILERLSARAKSALLASQKLAEDLRHKEIRPGHLLYGIVKESTSFAAEVVLKNKASAESVKTELVKLYTEEPPTETPPVLSEPLRSALEKAAVLAQRYNYRFIGTEHLLYALLDETAPSPLFQTLKLEQEEIKKNLKEVFENFSRLPSLGPADEEFNGEEAQDPPARGKTPTLDYFTTDLTARASAGKIDPLIGREKELARVITTLNRRQKNNPVLIGEPGVGKTAIVEGLALSIVRGEVPDFLLDKKILHLDLTLLVAGSMFRGEFENRLKQVIDEVITNPDIILFIDELHTVIGAGATTGSLDAANILKPQLARGELKVIGASTLTDYKKHIENDPAFERRFQPISVEEPNLEEAKKILHGIRPFYEKHHRVRISDEAIKLACELSSRYISDRFLPDKAIDLIDETAAELRAVTGTSKELRKIRTMEQAMKALEEKKTESVLNQNFKEALRIKLSQEKMTRDLEKLKARHSLQTTSREPVLSGEDIARTVSRITKIPLQKLAKKETRRLNLLEKVLAQHIVGQNEVTREIAQTIRRSRTGISSPARPQGSFLFLGPTGVGKTETAKVLAREIFGNDSDLIRVDMSEFMERHNVSRLIGAPAGYVGYEEGGRLTETIRRKPHSVVLFDEIEKAHPDVFNILLQILEEGELTDAAGKKVNFKNTIMILTSNIGSAEFNQYAIGFTERKATNINDELPDYEKVKETVLQALRNTLTPELLNRVDHVAVFRPLDSNALKKIARLELQKLAERLAAQQLQIKISAPLINFVNRTSFDPKQGARKIRRIIQTSVENLISENLLAGKIQKNSVIDIQVTEDKTQPLKLVTD